MKRRTVLVIGFTIILLVTRASESAPLSSYLLSSFTSPDPSLPFNHLTINNVTGDVYIGARERLYQLSSDLTLKQTVTLGQCPEVDNIVNVNDNKLLVVAPSPANKLITCGGCDGFCETRSLDDISVNVTSHNKTDSDRVVATGDRPTVGTVVRVVVGADSANGIPDDALYLFTGVRTDNKVVSQRDVADFIFSRGIVAPDGHENKYLQVISYKDFLYFFIQRNDVVYLGRLCPNSLDDNFESYSEIELQCGSHTVIQAAHIGPARYQLADSLGINSTDGVLYAVFGDGASLAESALCLYNMSGIQQSYQTAVLGCIRNGDNSGVAIDDLNGQCDIIVGAGPTYQPPDDAYLCTTLLELEGGPTSAYKYAAGVTPIQGTPLLSLSAITITSILTTQDREHTVAVVGTQDGDLIKVHIVNATFASDYETVPLGDGSVLRDTFLDEEKEELTLATSADSGSQVLKLSLVNCGQYETSDACIGVNGGNDGDPFCGWCTLEARCTRYEDCLLPDESTRWLPFDALRSINITDIQPGRILPRDQTEQEINITVQELPALQESEQYMCAFDSYEVPATTIGGQVSCLTPPAGNVPPLPQGSDNVQVTLSIVSSETGVGFISTVFIVFDCSVIESCSSCVTSPWTCDWCVYDNRCTSESSTCQADDAIIIGENNAIGSGSRGQSFCPQLLGTEQDYLLPVDITSGYKILASNLPTNQSLVQSFECILNVGGVELKVESTNYSADYVVCDPRSYSYADDILTKTVDVTVRWNGINNVDDLPETSVTLYKCSVNNGSCSRCLSPEATPPMLQCGWCETDCNVAQSDVCQTSIFLSLEQSSQCAGPVITDIFPLSGPIEGSTRLAITGTDLGVSFCNIRRISVAGIDCSLEDTDSFYEPGQSVSCVTGASTMVTAGSVEIFVSPEICGNYTDSTSDTTSQTPPSEASDASTMESANITTSTPTSNTMSPSETDDSTMASLNTTMSTPIYNTTSQAVTDNSTMASLNTTMSTQTSNTTSQAVTDNSTMASFNTTPITQTSNSTVPSEINNSTVESSNITTTPTYNTTLASETDSSTVEKANATSSAPGENLTSEAMTESTSSPPKTSETATASTSSAGSMTTWTTTSGSDSTTQQVDQNLRSSTSVAQFSYQDPIITSINPREGPVAGGTRITITGVFLDTGRDRFASLGDIACHSLTTTATEASCITNGTVDVTTALLTMTFDSADRTSTEEFAFRPNPVIDSTEAIEAFLAGGVDIQLTGTGFDLIQNPTIIVISRTTGVNNTEMCVGSSTKLTCPTPSYPGNDLRRRKRDESPIVANLIIDLDGYIAYEGEITYYPNPVYFDISDTDKIAPISGNRLLDLNGTDLDVAGSADVNDVKIFVGPDDVCIVKTIEPNMVRCKLPETEPEPGVYDGTGTINLNLPAIVVIHGNLVFYPGYVRYESALPLGPIIGGVAGGGALVLLVLIIIMVVFCRRSHKKLSEKDGDLEMLEKTIQGRVEKAFHDLQADMSEVEEQLRDLGIPFVNTQDYTKNMLFAGLDVQPSTSDPEVIEPEVEKAMKVFSRQLMNEDFLLQFIHQLEDKRKLRRRDRVNIASLLTVVLMTEGKFAYFTEILFKLLEEEIETGADAGRLRPLFRRTESIVEKLISNWLSLCMYHFLKKHVAESLYLLYQSIKVQVEKGPIDIITGQSYFSLNFDCLMEEDVDFIEVTLSVVGSKGDHEYYVSVLDVDSITQVKQKILDAAYRKKHFVKQSRAHEMDLLWYHKTGRQKILRDRDDSNAHLDNSRDLYINTVKSYGLKEDSRVALVEKTAVEGNTSDIYQPVTPGVQLFHTYEEFSGSFDVRSRDYTRIQTQVDTGPRIMHLIREEQMLTVADSVAIKLDKEFNAPRLLVTKRTIEPLLNRFLTVIFKKPELTPPTIKYLFDFFDKMAAKHCVDEGSPEECAEAWKSNSLPLHYWITTLTHPSYLFDMRQARSADQSVSVIANMLDNACKKIIPENTQDSALSRVLYYKDLPTHIQSISEYYENIQRLKTPPQVELDEAFTAVSQEFSGLFSRVGTLRQLYDFTYNDTTEMVDSIIEMLSG